MSHRHSPYVSHTNVYVSFPVNVVQCQEEVPLGWLVSPWVSGGYQPVSQPEGGVQTLGTARKSFGALGGIGGPALSGGSSS